MEKINFKIVMDNFLISYTTNRWYILFGLFAGLVLTNEQTGKSAVSYIKRAQI